MGGLLKIIAPSPTNILARLIIMVSRISPSSPTGRFPSVPTGDFLHAPGRFIHTLEYVWREYLTSREFIGDSTIGINSLREKSMKIKNYRTNLYLLRHTLM